jgi:hypothetical protein
VVELPQLRSAEAFATQEANAWRCEMADARIQRLKVERANGASDAPYSQQQRDRRALRRQELETEMLQQTSIAKPFLLQAKRCGSRCGNRHSLSYLGAEMSIVVEDTDRNSSAMQSPRC